MSTVEQRINAIEQALRALKASYPTVGSRVRFYVQKSQEFTKTVAAGKSEIARIKFVPDYGLGQANIVSLRAIVSVNGNGGYAPSETEIQDGSGEVIIKVKLDAGIGGADFRITVVASGSLPGKFYMI